MGFERGSLLLVDYTATLKDSGEVVDTTRQEDAGKMANPNPDTNYEPRLISVGDNAYMVNRGLDAALFGAEVGVSQTVEVAPADAYGEVNRSKVKMLTIRKLGDSADKAAPGDILEVGGRKGVVRFVGSGRVKMDFNHAYAGKIIVYDFVVTRELVENYEKIEALLENFGFLETFKDYQLEDDKLVVKVPKSLFRSKDLQTKKFFLQANLFQFVPSLQEMEFVESYTNPITAPDT